MRGSEEDVATFKFMDVLDGIYKLNNDEQFLEAYGMAALKMTTMPYTMQEALITSDEWNKCEARLNKLARKAKIEPRLSKAEQKKVKEATPGFFGRIMEWIRS